MPFTGPKLTNFGLSVLLKTQQSKTLHFTRIALGDGEIGSSSMLTRKTLISEKLSVLIDAVRLSDTSASIVAQVSNDTLTEGFYFREKGVYCQDPDTQEEGLFVYDNCREDGEYINAKDSAHKVSFYLREHLTFSQTPQITFDASGNPIYVLYDDFNAQNNENDTRFTAIEESVSGHETNITQLQSEVDSDETVMTAQGEQITSLDAAKADKSITAPVTLTAAGWVENKTSGWWTQGVSNPAIVDGRKVDIAFPASVIKQLAENGTSVMVVNHDGTASAYAFGAKPSTDLSAQIEIREVIE